MNKVALVFWGLLLGGLLAGAAIAAQAVPPPCTPLALRFTVDSSEAELSQGDISYAAIRVTTPDGRYQGHVVIAGDQDVPLIAFLRARNHSTVAVTFCPSEASPQ
jgi:hypothetical protein